MSKTAPWLALSVDWQDSEMFDDAPHGHRLAWICLLCFAKAQGRAGKVRFRDKKFAEKYRLSMESVEAMVASAAAAGAVIVEGDVVTVVNWKDYQDPRVRSAGPDNHLETEAEPAKRRRFTKTAKNDATPHPPPITKDQPPLPPLPPTLDCDRFREELAQWLEYKGRKYKPAGLRALVSRAAKLAQVHGVNSVADAMERARGNGWEGWDQESSFERRGHGRRDNAGAGGEGRERTL